MGPSYRHPVFIEKNFQSFLPSSGRKRQPIFIKLMFSILRILRIINNNNNSCNCSYIVSGYFLINPAG